MFLAFGMGLAASGCKLCDIDEVLFKVEITCQRFGKSGENIPIIIKIEKATLWFILVVQGLPNLLLRDLVTLI